MTSVSGAEPLECTPFAFSGPSAADATIFPAAPPAPLFLLS
jgi:hypothetical protein